MPGCRMQAFLPTSPTLDALALAAEELPGRRGAGHRGVPGPAPAAAAAPRGRGRRRQDRGGQGARRPGPAASWSASSATRASTPPRPSTSGTTPASCCTSGRPRPPGGPPTGAEALEAELYDERFLVRRPLLARPRPPAERPAAGAAHRRGRPGRRRVRGLPARAARRLGGHDPRARHRPGRGAAGRRAHLEPHPRRARRPEAPLPLPLGRAPDFEREVAIVRLRAPEVAPAPGPPGGAAVGGIRHLGLYKPPGRRRDDRLGQRARHPRAAPSSTTPRVAATLGAVVKYREDEQRVRAHGIDELVREAVRLRA